MWIVSRVRAGLGANACILPLNMQPNCTALPGMLFFWDNCSQSLSILM